MEQITYVSRVIKLTRRSFDHGSDRLLYTTSQYSCRPVLSYNTRVNIAIRAVHQRHCIDRKLCKARPQRAASNGTVLLLLYETSGLVHLLKILTMLGSHPLTVHIHTPPDIKHWLRKKISMDAIVLHAIVLLDSLVFGL